MIYEQSQNTILNQTNKIKSKFLFSFQMRALW